jgi:hypothetical protein
VRNSPQLFMGSLGQCTDASISTKADCLAARDADIAAAAAAGAAQSSSIIHWVNPNVGSFDDFFSSMLLLYVMSTKDGWTTQMYAMMDSVGVGMGPQRNDFSPYALFSILWMVRPPRLNQRSDAPPSLGRLRAKHQPPVAREQSRLHAARTHSHAARERPHS